jgi:hypothetical protein
MPYEVQQAIRATCDEIITDLGNGLMFPRLPARCLPGIDRTAAAAAAAQIRAEPALANDLTRAIIALDTRILNFGKLEVNAREVRQYMEGIGG